MGGKVKVREVLLYSERIKSEDVLNFFNQIMKSRLPLFGFLDFSDFLSLNVANTIIKRRLNTVQFFIREKKSLAELSLLVFPYKLSDPTELEKISGTFLPLPKFYFLIGNQDFLGFTVKESMEEVNLRIMKIFGKFIAIGTAVDERKQKHVIICASPERFYVSDLEKNPSVYIEILDPIPKRMSVTSRFPVFEETGISVGVDNFDVFQHTLFVGASGTGKSKGLYAMIKAIEAKHGDGVRIVMIDPHGEFIRCFPGAKVVNLIDNYIEPLDVGGIKTPLMTQLIAQLLSSSVGQENKYSERVLFYATHLLSSINKMDLRNISLLLTDSSKRAEFISETENDEVKRFFDEEFNDIYIHHFNDAVLPVLNFVGEYELYLGGDKKRENLLDLIKNNRLTIVSFNPNFFGKRMINFLAGAIVNQMYILAITERLNMPTILVMDEFQRVETRVVKDILSETRKFNLYVYLSMQYLGQLSKEVNDSIVSNIRNIVSFKANRQDATMLSSIMEIKIEESFKKSRSQTELEESKKEMFVRLHQKECIVRLFDGKKYILPMKLRVVDVYSKWGYHELPLEQVMPMSKVPPSMMNKGEAQEAAQARDGMGQESADGVQQQGGGQSFQQSYASVPDYQSGVERQENEGQEGGEGSSQEGGGREEGRPSRKKTAVELQIEAAKKAHPTEPEEQKNEWMSFKREREQPAHGISEKEEKEDKGGEESQQPDDNEQGADAPDWQSEQNDEDKGQSGEEQGAESEEEQATGKDGAGADWQQAESQDAPTDAESEQSKGEQGTGEGQGEGERGADEEAQSEEFLPRRAKPLRRQIIDERLSRELSDKADSVPEYEIQRLEEELMFNEKESAQEAPAAKARAKPAKKPAGTDFEDFEDEKPAAKRARAKSLGQDFEYPLDKPGKPAKKKAKAKEAPDFEFEAEEDAPPVAKKKAKAKAAPAQEEFEFPSEDEPEKPSSAGKKSASTPAKKAAPARKASPVPSKKPAGKKRK